MQIRDIKWLHPELIPIVEKLQQLCRDAGLPLLITETFRTKERQDELYAQGRTAKGNIVTNVKYPDSAHCWGVAFDFCRNVKGREYSNVDNFFNKVAALGKPLGLTWGGDWTGFVDMPHFEFTKLMPDSSVAALKKQYKTPANFMETWIDAKKAAETAVKNTEILRESDKMTNKEFADRLTGVEKNIADINKKLTSVDADNERYRYIDENTAKISPDTNDALRAAAKKNAPVYGSNGFDPPLSRDMVRQVVWNYRLGLYK